jgi:hypothetical protein
MPTNIGTANYAAYQGVPATTVTWTGRSSTSRAGTIFTAIDKEPLTDDSDTRDNQGEIQAERTRNDRMRFTFSVKPVGANAAAALAIAGDLPRKKSLVTVSGDAADTDMSAAGSILVESARTAYTPEGEAIVTLTVIKHYGKTFSALS